MNGHLAWDDNLVDLTERYEVTVRLIDLQSTPGLKPAPDSARVDITLRRLQKFSVRPLQRYAFENRNAAGQIIQRSMIQADALGLLTVSQFIVKKEGNRLVISQTTTVVNEQANLPQAFVVAQNYPNPFSANGTFGNPQTTISYVLPQRAHVQLVILNNIGQEIERLVDGEQPIGQHTVNWSASGLASGTYFFSLRAGSFEETKRMTLVR